jgi:hypothetical protein
MFNLVFWDFTGENFRNEELAFPPVETELKFEIDIL